MDARNEEWSASAAGLTLPELLERSTQQRADRAAVIDERGTWTYRDLLVAATRMAGGLAAAGVREGDVVGLWLPNSAFWLQAHLALAHLGAIAVGINARYPVAETARILSAADVRTLVVDPGSTGVADSGTVAELVMMPDVELDTVISRAGWLALPDGIASLDANTLPTRTAPLQATPRTPSTVFTSSGSTGAPKLILHSQGGIRLQSDAIAASFGYTAPDAVVLGQLPLCGVWGFNTVYAALAGGATVVLMQRFDAAVAVQLVERHRVTHANGPDLFVRQLFGAAESDRQRVGSLRAIGFSTFSNDSRELVDLGDRFKVTLFQVYGSSEQQALMVHQPLDADAERRAVPGGPPTNPATRMRIRDADSGELLGYDTPGLLETTGPNVMLGYLGRDGIDTSALTDDGWLRTGDIAMTTHAGLHYLSRAKDVLRLSGFLVDPAEIEQRIEEFPDVVEAKVVGIDTARGSRCVAFVRTADPNRFDEEQLLTACRRSLASFKVPVRIFPVAEFPRVDGANGPRIQRLALRTMAAERLTA
jgi:fatty-acyl-CoA synthase